jgi:hypothetical protein
VLDNLEESSIISVVVVFGTIMPVLDMHVVDNPSLFNVLLLLTFYITFDHSLYSKSIFKIIIYFVIIWFIIKGI